MAARASSSVTRSRARCAACPSGTNSCTEGGGSHASFPRHGRKLFAMPPSESPSTAEVEPLWPYRDTLLGPLVAEDDGAGGGEHAANAMAHADLRALDLRRRGAAHLPH